VLTRLEFNNKINTCIIHLAENMCEEETTNALDALQHDANVKSCDHFIALIPDKFTACEEFRLQIHRLIVSERKRNPKFKIAEVTRLHQVIGYERFAKLVTQMVGREEIFEKMEDAISWLSK